MPSPPIALFIVMLSEAHKASGGDGIPVELFQILKDDAVKVLHSICPKFGKRSIGHKKDDPTLGGSFQELRGQNP